MLFEASGTTLFGSIPIVLPKPSHVGQAPTGLLKLNKSGLGSENVIPSRSNRLLNAHTSFSSEKTTEQSPFPSKKAISRESANRDISSFAADTDILSMTICKLRSLTSSAWFFSRSSSIKTAPLFVRTLENPC